jgi:hypothetical protein
MFETLNRKTVFERMFERENVVSNKPRNLAFKGVRGEKRVLRDAYEDLEHCKNLFEQSVRELSLSLEHNTAPLGKAVFVREGAQQEIAFLRSAHWEVFRRPRLTPVNNSPAEATPGNPCLPRRHKGCRFGDAHLPPKFSIINRFAWFGSPALRPSCSL